MKKYEALKIKIIFYLGKNIITDSPNEHVDDLGGWNYNWFTQGDD